MSGELEPGDVYSAPALGASSASRPRRCARRCWIWCARIWCHVPNKGYRVTTMDEADLDDITELRMLVEPPLTAQITPDVPAGDMPALRELAQAIVDGALAGDLVAYTEADRAFHLKLLEYAGNRRILALVSDLRAHTRLYGLAAMLERGELEGSAREHHEILDAIEAREPSKAEELMRAHISQVRGAWANPEPTQRQ